MITLTLFLILILLSSRKSKNASLEIEVHAYLSVIQLFMAHFSLRNGPSSYLMIIMVPKGNVSIFPNFFLIEK